MSSQYLAIAFTSLFGVNNHQLLYVIKEVVMQKD
jgi:hypothetical protein